MTGSLSKNTISFITADRASSYQKLLDRIPDCTWLMDDKGQIILSNSLCQKHLKLISFSSKPDFIWDLIQSTAKTKLQAEWQNICRKKDVWSCQLELKNNEDQDELFTLEIEQFASDEKGNSVLFICTATPVKNAVGNNLSNTELISDIADYKQKELVLIRQAEFVRRILESNEDCIKVLDLQGHLLYMNDGGQKIMEIDNFESQVQNALWLNFWSGCDRQAAEIAFAEACAGKTGKFDGYCNTAKGTLKCWEVVVTPMFDDCGNVKEILSVSRDISDRKTVEEALQKRNRELDQFTYIVSHDLKAPLRGISNLSEMILEDIEEQIPAENRHQLHLLQQRVLRMNALIDGLLKYSRVGKEEIAIESFEMEELLKEVIDSLNPPPSFKINYHKPLPSLHTKKLLLNQILANLISNAIKHHHSDEGQIDFIVKDHGQHYEFAIADDGPGIPEEHRDRIFEIFQTLENKSSTTNTGIGLALIQKIVQGEGGKFWLDSQTEKGAKFCFTWKKE